MSTALDWILSSVPPMLQLAGGDGSGKLMSNVYLLGFRTGQWTARATTATPPAPSDIWTLIANFPALYKMWWVNLYYNDPLHVIVETTLLLSIVYILVSRSKDWKENDATKEKLTAKEEEELLREWKQTRAPLVAPIGDDNDDDDEDPSLPSVVVHAMHGRTLDITTPELTQVQTVLNFATFDFLGMSAVVASAAASTGEANNNNNNNGGSPSSNASIGGNSNHSNNSSSNINISNGNPVKESALEALDRYGCGSCGPRGFYGTVDVHLHMERTFSQFLGTPDSILYSDGASACASTVAAFCKRGDLIVADQGLYEPLKTGIGLSRAHVKWFQHNDMDDLRQILASVQATDKKLGRPPNAQRRFLVVEGLYKNSGTICPLDELVKLKHEFSYRLILDESFSFGTLGRTGRGAMEEFGCEVMRDAEIVTVGMENSMGSVGGITTGTEEVVDHQRLSGSGYCFSASSPPFTAVAAMAALERLQADPDLLQRLQDNRTYLYEKLKGFCHSLEDLLQITSDERSPICMLQVADIPETEYLDDVVFLKEVVKESLAAGCAFATVHEDVPNPANAAATALQTVSNNNSNSSGGSANPSSTPEIVPAIRISISAAHTFDDIDKALGILRRSVDVIMNRFHEEFKEEE